MEEDNIKLIKYKFEISGFYEKDGKELPLSFKDLTESELAHIFILISKGQLHGAMECENDE